MHRVMGNISIFKNHNTRFKLHKCFQMFKIIFFFAFQVKCFTHMHCYLQRSIYLLHCECNKSERPKINALYKYKALKNSVSRSYLAIIPSYLSPLSLPSSAFLLMLHINLLSIYPYTHLSSISCIYSMF